MAGRSSVFLLLVVVVCTGQVSAWFDGGHMFVASLASDRVSDKTYHYLGKVMGHEPSCSADGVCKNQDLQNAMIVDSVRMDMWKDVMKNYDTAAYHFLDFPYYDDKRHYIPDADLSQLGVTRSPQDSRDPQLLYRLRKALDGLKESARKYLREYIWWKKSHPDEVHPETAKFIKNWHLLVHMIGDVGQPLHTTSRHCSRSSSDLGSNRFWFFTTRNKKLGLRSSGSESYSLEYSERRPQNMKGTEAYSVNVALKSVLTEGGKRQQKTSYLSSLHQLWDCTFGVVPYFNMMEGRDPLRPRYEKAGWTLAYAREAFGGAEKPACMNRDTVRSGDCSFYSQLMNLIRRGHKRAMYATDAPLLEFDYRACSGAANVDKIFGAPSTESDMSSYIKTSREYQALGISEAADLLVLALEEIFEEAEAYEQDAVKHFNNNVAHEVSRAVSTEKARRAEEERKRLEAERLEKERLARLEEERLEKERLARLEEERLEKERLARLEEERLEKERLAKLEAEREAERLEMERLEKERLEKERLEKEEAARVANENNKSQDGENSELASDEDVRTPPSLSEAERLEKERLEKERLEKEGAESQDGEDDGHTPSSSLEDLGDGSDDGGATSGGDSADAPMGAVEASIDGPDAPPPPVSGRPSSHSGDEIPVPEVDSVEP